MWNDEVFKMSSCWNASGTLAINGYWVDNGAHCVIINVYSPCGLAEKLRLWDCLATVAEQYSDSCVCMIGDFNAILEEDKRCGLSEEIDSREIRFFKDFIESNNLIDLQIIGRKFTWYRPDGSAKSRLDRIIVNNEWLNQWPHARLKGCCRSISDHVPIFTDMGKIDWGPKPFKFFNS